METMLPQSFEIQRIVDHRSACRHFAHSYFTVAHFSAEGLKGLKGLNGI